MTGEFFRAVQPDQDLEGIKEYPGFVQYLMDSEKQLRPFLTILGKTGTDLVIPMARLMEMVQRHGFPPAFMGIAEQVVQPDLPQCSICGCRFLATREIVTRSYRSLITMGQECPVCRKLLDLQAFHVRSKMLTHGTELAVLVALTHTLKPPNVPTPREAI